MSQKGMRFFWISSYLMLCLSFWSHTASAEDQLQICPICKTANNESISYSEKATSTLARGALNAALGWTDIIRIPAQETKSGENVLTGIANGIGSGISRTLVGFAEVFTFWTPKFQGNYIHFSKDCPLDTSR